VSLIAFGRRVVRFPFAGQKRTGIMTTLTDSNLHSGTVTAFFDTREAASKAVDGLVASGIPRYDVSMTSAGAAGAPESDKGFWESLKDLFMPEEDRYAYAEGLRRGGTVVSVRTNEANYDRALEILDAEGSVNLDEREETWRSEGWKGYQGSAYSDAGGGLAADAAISPAVAPAASLSGAPSTSLPAGKDEVIPVYEEQLSVGKRDVNHGRVRVRSYVVETPVSEQVNLRNESVRVERKPVDRPIGAADAVFQDRVIEAEEHVEEAVVAKQARVKEEITLKKTSENETRTISDSVRSTKVDIEDERASGVLKPTPKSAA
jgi:uncharacterized protein (TIGR02271 family)